MAPDGSYYTIILFFKGAEYHRLRKETDDEAKAFVDSFRNHPDITAEHSLKLQKVITRTYTA